jgi:predicted RNase H-like HicB family nuclease
LRSYLVVFEKAPRNWGAYCPDLPGCVAVGKTKAEAKRLIRQAIEFHLEGMKHHKLRPPKATASAEVVDVPA